MKYKEEFMLKEKGTSTDELTELVRTLIIVQLGLASVPQRSIRSIACCDMNRVTKIIKKLNTKKKSKKKE
jgi:hypothetical protein